jgi:hypothetical protein
VQFDATGFDVAAVDAFVPSASIQGDDVGPVAGYERAGASVGCVGGPGFVGGVEQCGWAPAGDAVALDVVVDRTRVAVAQGESGGGLVGIGEVVEVGEEVARSAARTGNALRRSPSDRVSSRKVGPSLKSMRNSDWDWQRRRALIGCTPRA